MTWVANARMYSVTPQASAAWKRFFDWLEQQTAIEFNVLDHAFPAPLSELWSRGDLACAFICGFPYLKSFSGMKPVASPIPKGQLYGGRPDYATHLVVRAASDFLSLEDTFGGRLGYTVEDSHSGYNALRHHLLPYWSKRRERLYAETVGPLFTPRRVMDVLLSDRIDVGPLDSYAFTLIEHHAPELARQLRVVSTTEVAPIPFLAASVECPDAIVQTLAQACLKLEEDETMDALREDLQLLRFEPVKLENYRKIIQWEHEALVSGFISPF